MKVLGLPAQRMQERGFGFGIFAEPVQNRLPRLKAENRENRIPVRITAEPGSSVCGVG